MLRIEVDGGDHRPPIPGKFTPTFRTPSMPRLVEPVTVVDLPGKVKINEFFGGASCAPCGSAAGPDISMAHVVAKKGFAEDWQTPAFDEYVLVLKGSVSIEYAHGSPVIVPAGKGVFLPKGERVRWTFLEDAEYVPVCLPAFSPTNIFREEEGDAAPLHDAHTNIYHLVQKELWEACKTSSQTYYPPTYEADGFTHATADPAYLIGVANHFYKDTKAEWLCLGMTRASLAAANVTLKFEDPSPVGTTRALNAEQSGGMRFPHIYGGIPPSGGVVCEERVVSRAEDGTFLSIDGLC
jgi:uncharacterized protein (DUF952 family)/quercetin dioxygenase-like cupin family protein